MPFISVPTVGLFLLEVRGYSRLYEGFDASFYGICKNGFFKIHFYPNKLFKIRLDERIAQCSLLFIFYRHDDLLDPSLPPTSPVL